MKVEIMIKGFVPLGWRRGSDGQPYVAHKVVYERSESFHADLGLYEGLIARSDDDVREITKAAKEVAERVFERSIRSLREDFSKVILEVVSVENA